MTSRAIADLSVFPIGLGAMPLSKAAMANERPRALATIYAALDSGMTLLDTADIYAPDAQRFGHNEVLVGEALRSWAGSAADRERIVVATKGGITRTAGPQGEVWGRSGTPQALGAAALASAQRLGVEAIDLYYLHRLDPQVPFDEQIGALAQVKADGVARRIGLSNVTRAQLDRAVQLVGGPAAGGICAVQNEFSPRYRGDADVLDRCAEAGIAFLPWSPLGGDSRAADAPGSRYAPFAEIAAEREVTSQQVILAWLLALAGTVIPIPGCTRPATARASATAAEIELTPDEVARLSATEHDARSAFPDDTPPPPM